MIYRTALCLSICTAAFCLHATNHQHTLIFTNHYQKAINIDSFQESGMCVVNPASGKIQVAPGKTQKIVVQDNGNQNAGLLINFKVSIPYNAWSVTPVGIFNYTYLIKHYWRVTPVGRFSNTYLVQPNTVYASASFPTRSGLVPDLEISETCGSAEIPCGKKLVENDGKVANILFSKK